MKNLRFLYLVFITLSVIMFSCREDFELNAPYKDNTIVYGLVDQGVDTQFIKINRSFIGSGNNLNYAHINDCTIYQSIIARVDKMKNGVVQNSYPLSEKYVANIDPGVFYTDSQKVYYFVAPSIDQDATYRLIASLNEGSKEVTAETKIVKQVSFDPIFNNNVSANGVVFADVQTPVNGQYKTMQMIWRTTDNGKRYTPFIRFYYTEHTASGSEEKMIEWVQGTQESESTVGGKSMTAPLSGAAFYGTVASRLSNDPAVTKRVIGRFEFLVSVADEDLNTYIKLNQPAQGVVTERPVYTNVNNGLGIFGSRYTARISVGQFNGKHFKMNKFSVQELCEGQYTSHLKFCTDSLAWQTESFFCN